MNDTDLLRRLEHFERTVVTCLCALPALFAAQCLAVALALPVFAAMFRDFGSPLPGPTQFVLDGRVLWLLVAIALPAGALLASRKRSSRFSIIFSTASGLLLFVLAQFLTLAAMLPILELASAASSP